MQQMKNESLLRSVAQPLTELWNKSITVASVCRIVAIRTRLSADEAFLAGLLHGIGNLYIMARAATQGTLGAQSSWMELVLGWQASIGKAVLESWGFSQEMCDAVGEQGDHERRWKHEASLGDVLVASLTLADCLSAPEPRVVAIEGNNTFLTVGVKAADCAAILAEAQQQISLVHEALGS
jgi:HD-like signal output (HDOD) protein